MPSVKLHSCITNKCTGEKYSRIYLNCSVCKNPYFLECMRNKDDNIKDILCMFGLANKTKGGSYELMLENTEKVNFFKSCFSEKSPLAVNCDICSDAKKNTETNDEFFEMASDYNKNNEKSIGDMISKEIKKLKIEIIAELETIVNKKESVKTDSKKVEENILNKNEILKIYISTNDYESTPDKIISLILENSNIENVETFSVNQLLNLNIAIKRGHQSFELITVSKKVYETILNHCNWPDGFKVKKFNEKKNSTKPMEPKKETKNVNFHPNYHTNSQYISNNYRPNRQNFNNNIHHNNNNGKHIQYNNYQNQRSNTNPNNWNNYNYLNYDRRNYTPFQKTIQYQPPPENRINQITYPDYRWNNPYQYQNQNHIHPKSYQYQNQNQNHIQGHFQKYM